jgi:hypothetical protein
MVIRQTHKIISIVPDKIVLEEISPTVHFLNFDISIADVNNIISPDMVPAILKRNPSCIIKPIRTTKFNTLISLVISVFQKLGLPASFFIKLKLKKRLEYYASDYFDTFHSKDQNSQYVILVNANNDPLVNSILERYKVGNSNNVKIITIAHARAVLTNTLHNKNIYSLPVGKDYFSISGIKYADAIQIDSPIVYERYKWLQPDLIKKATMLQSLRYTSEWNSLCLNQEKQHKQVNNSSVELTKSKILYLHSNFNTNIFEYEVWRSIQIIDKQQSFAIGFRPHIRMGILYNDKEMKYLFKGVSSFEVFRSSIWDAIKWSDVVVFYGSSSCIDALIAGKIVIFLLYATSNTLDKNLYDYIYVCHSPDEFIQTIIALKEDRLAPKNKFPTPNIEELITDWEKFILS